jgi:hypothetical protein
MSIRFGSSMIDLFRRAIDACGVEVGQKVAVLSEGTKLRDYAAANFAA